MSGKQEILFAGASVIGLAGFSACAWYVTPIVVGFLASGVMKLWF